MSITVAVQGMTCQHCVDAVTAAVSALPGVSAVDVDLEAGEVRVSGTPENDAVTAAIEDAGYDVTPSA
jgi:copper ion binding protein